MPEKYLFSWENVPGNDSSRLMRFLTENLGICWEERVEIRKSDDGKVICVSMDKNSVEIGIDEGEEKVTLKISSGTTLKIKKVNDGRNIYSGICSDDVEPTTQGNNSFSSLTSSGSTDEHTGEISGVEDSMNQIRAITAQTYRNCNPMLARLGLIQLGTTDDIDIPRAIAVADTMYGLSPYGYLKYPPWLNHHLFDTPDSSIIDENQTNGTVSAQKRPSRKGTADISI